MPDVSREQTHAALQAFLAGRLQGDGKLFVTVDRRLKHWDDVPDVARPSLHIATARENRRLGYGQRQEARRTSFDLYLYATVPPDTDPMAVLNPLLDALDAALDPGPVQETQQLLAPDGTRLVDHVWIEADSQVFEGNLGTTAVAIVPLEMLVAASPS